MPYPAWYEEMHRRSDGMPTSRPGIEFEPCPHCGVDNADHVADDNPTTCHACAKEYFLDVDDDGSTIFRAIRSPADMDYLDAVAAAGSGCVVITTGQGNAAHVHVNRDMSDESLTALERLIDAATEDMKRRRQSSPNCNDGDSS